MQVNAVSTGEQFGQEFVAKNNARCHIGIDQRQYGEFAVVMKQVHDLADGGFCWNRRDVPDNIDRSGGVIKRKPFCILSVFGSKYWTVDVLYGDNRRLAKK